MDSSHAAAAIQKAVRKKSLTRGTLSGEGAAGFIRVAVRVRPLGERRGERGVKVKVDSASGVISVQQPLGAAAAAAAASAGKSAAGIADRQNFAFERVYETESNEQLLVSVGKPLVASVCQGYNGTLFAYGQTGSGKTYTIGEMAKLGTEHEGKITAIDRL